MAERSGMYIRMAWLRQKARCRWCSEVILAGQAVVRGMSWVTDGDTKRHYLSIWHPECWLKQGMDYLESHPYIPKQGGPGRPRLQLTVEQRIKRRSCTVMFAKLKMEKMQVLTAGTAQWHMPQLEERGRQLMERMKGLGGVPRSWTA